ncbi:MAG: flagellar protein FlbB [Treponema sp.]|nr:flagellar protein FlbB [Treponema sp.]MCI5666867.1 flagellar protein FlbB [Spirochaetia bacterium]MDD7767222.1 flagellar protein FlbB [Treponema sp.]MDY3131016.1 flagellar protein FlbB [Treponema sp.]
MSAKKNLGKSFILLIIIIILVLGGLLWFDRLGVIHVKSLFSPLYKAIGREPQTSSTSTQTKPLVKNLDEDRLNKQKEALTIQLEELEKREADIISAEQLNAQIAEELAEREKNQEEREKTFNLELQKYDTKNVNIEQIAKNLNGMRPEAAVNILIAMDDQDVIDVLRKVEEIAAAEGTASMGSYWLSLMPADRVAQINRKSINKPDSLD